jgi:hypothetical protein
MPHPTLGDKVYIPIEIVDGAFPGESLVTVETTKGPISGFAKSANILKKDDHSYLLAEVTDVAQDTLTVRLFGSFFRTTGLAYISSDSNLLRAG